MLSGTDTAAKWKKATVMLAGGVSVDSVGQSGFGGVIIKEGILLCYFYSKFYRA